jgi:uncharacterized protein YbjQ (UPF0145 family)
MKKTLSALVFFGFSAVVCAVQAADEKVMLPVEAAFAQQGTRENVDGSVKFFFGKQKTPKLLQKLGSDSNARKANAFGKSKETSCNTAFLSAMIGLEKRAHELGANAVVNIVSNYNHQEMSSETEFECHVGAIMSGVAFKADFVKVAGQ